MVRLGRNSILTYWRAYVPFARASGNSRILGTMPVAVSKLERRVLVPPVVCYDAQLLLSSSKVRTLQKIFGRWDFGGFSGQIEQESSYDSESVYRSIFELRRRLSPQDAVLLDLGNVRSSSSWQEITENSKISASWELRTDLGYAILARDTLLGDRVGEWHVTSKFPPNVNQQAGNNPT